MLFELGVYNHIPGDGREYVVTDSTALKLRSEDGRFIRMDISFLSMIFLTKKTPAVSQQRMPAAVPLRQPGSLRAWKPEAGSFFWMKIHLPQILW